MKTFFIRTYGCQMNELDSEVMAGILKKRGLILAPDESKADIIIFNTCSVRDLAERKVMGKIGILARKKKKAIIGVTGCMASLKNEKILKKNPYIDFVLGTNNIPDLNSVLDEIIDKKSKVALSDFNQYNPIDYSLTERSSNIKAYVSIIRGCDNFCSYCVVPYTRGREISRPFNSIIEECQALADKGYKEITLLGQNVNSYGKDNPSLNGNFADLLYKLDKIQGIERIRFLTSHPKDITEELMHVIKELPSVCEFVHFPFQSGSSRILKMMNRNYTKDDYLQKVMKLKEIIPNIALGTDVIVGFPSESEEEFLETYKLMKQIRFSLAFMFAYSPRKDTPAYKMTDNITLQEKDQRLQKLLALYQQILDEEGDKTINSSFEVLVDNFDPIKNIAKGRTRCFKKVVFEGTKEMVGTLQNVQFKSHQYQTFSG